MTLLSRSTAFHEPPIFALGSPGRSGASLPTPDVPEANAAAAFGELARKAPAGLPEVSEPEAFRHYVRLSQQNYCIDTQMIPLGSCTMKYNPKVNEWAARIENFARLHPLAPDELAQGTLQLMGELMSALCEITGMDGCHLQPAAGAHGELTGLMMMRAFHEAGGRSPKKVLIPDSAHGTNPASCAINGLEAIKISRGSGDVLDMDTLRAAIDALPAGELFGLMITNPNTLGVFETHIREICELVHARGGLVYGDGANTNAVLGRARAGDAGVDVVHLNLHKTFTTPHGGGGPGSGPVCFKKHLAPFQPTPALANLDGAWRWTTPPQSIGRTRAFNGNFGMFVRAYAYIREMGGDGLTQASGLAVLNARYLWSRLQAHFTAPVKEPCMHEVILSDAALEKETGIKTLDIAKRLLDHGFHAPTVYFPLVVPGAIMIEPTETETRQTLDEFADALISIAAEARTEPATTKGAPHLTRLGRLDEARAARSPRLRWTPI